MSPHEQTHLGTVFFGEIPHPNRFWVEILKNIMGKSGCFCMLSAASFLFWAPAMMSENLSDDVSQLQIYKSQSTAPESPSKVWNQDVNISKYYDYKVLAVLVFLLCSHTHLTHLSWSLANSQASGRTPMSQQGRNAAWISVCCYQQHWQHT